MGEHLNLVGGTLNLDGGTRTPASPYNLSTAYKTLYTVYNFYKSIIGNQNWYFFGFFQSGFNPFVLKLVFGWFHKFYTIYWYS